jgi:hypothetical protein
MSSRLAWQNGAASLAFPRRPLGDIRRTRIDDEEIRSSPGISGRAGVSSLWNALCRAFDPWKAKGSTGATRSNA